MNQGIPKSARDLLARQTPADEHPSADLLNGYMEQSLTAGEAAQVVNHLASCAECREIVFVARAVKEEEVPALEPATTVGEQLRAPATAGRPKVRWIRWKWAVPMLAAVAVVAGVLVERERMAERAPSRLTQTIAMNRHTAPAAAPSEPRANSNEAAPPPTTEASKTNVAPQPRQIARGVPTKDAVAQQELAKKTEALRRDALELAQMASSLDNSKAKMVGGAAGQNGAPAAPPAKPPVSAASSQAVEVTSAAPLVQADNADLSTNFAHNAPNGGNDLTYIQKPAASLKSGLASSAQPAASPVNKMVAQKTSLPVPHWRISADGHLERALPGSAWTRVLADQPVVFRVVATVGSSVWAGGNDAALFHSGDQGATWSRVALSADGQTERGAIVSIRFESTVQGSLSTTSGAIWITSDGGQTWLEQ